MKMDRPSLVKASLEVLGNDGHPYSWRGNVRPIYEPLSTLWTNDHCLTVDPANLGVIAGSSIIIHDKITTGLANAKFSKEAKKI